MAFAHLTRRRFLAAGAALPLALRSEAHGDAMPHWVFLGSDKGEGIYRARWNADSGELTGVELAFPGPPPSYLALHPTLPVLFSANEPAGTVSSFRIDREHATLQQLSTLPSHGAAPCYLGVALPWLFIANYSGGSLTAMHVNDDGRLRNAHTFTCKDHPGACGTLGPVTDRQDAPHIHCATPFPGGSHVLSCDLGDDALLVFTPPSARGLAPPARFAARPGSGPRHVAFHPNGQWLYCIHELDCTIDLYRITHANGAPELSFDKTSVLSTLAPGKSSHGNTACEILISPDGRFAYACTRFVDEITTYSIDPATGHLTELQRLSCGGKIPRYIAFDPTRRWLLSCNQDAPGSVTVFAHDPATAHIDPAPRSIAVPTCEFVLWI